MCRNVLKMLNIFRNAMKISGNMSCVKIFGNVCISTEKTDMCENILEMCGNATKISGNV